MNYWNEEKNVALFYEYSTGDKNAETKMFSEIKTLVENFMAGYNPKYFFTDNTSTDATIHIFSNLYRYDIKKGKLFSFCTRYTTTFLNSEKRKYNYRRNEVFKNKYEISDYSDEFVFESDDVTEQFIFEQYDFEHQKEIIKQEVWQSQQFDYMKKAVLCEEIDACDIQYLHENSLYKIKKKLKI